MSEEKQATQGVLKEPPGGAVIWIFVVVELLTFGAFLGAFAAGYSAEFETFRDSQKLLHPGMGTINTAILLTGSWMVARALLTSGKRVAGWFVAAGVGGVAFLVIKSIEYTYVFAHDVSLSTNGFWFYYLFLTFMHYLHVVFGVGLMFWLGWRTRRGIPSEEFRAAMEASAIYWHLVDLIWILVFPTLYLLHLR